MIFFKKKKQTILDSLSSRKDIEKNRTRKTLKPFFYLGGIGFAVFIYMFTITLMDNYKKATEQQIKKQEAATVDIPMDNFQLWQNKTDTEMEDIRKDMKRIENNMTASVEKGINKVVSIFNERTDKMIQSTQNLQKEQTKQVNESIKKIETKIYQKQEETIAYIDNKIKKIELPAEKQIKANIENGALFLPKPSSKDSNNTVNAKHEKKIGFPKEPTIIYEEVAITKKKNKEEEQATQKDNNASIKFHIPMGMAKGTIVSGVNAPIFNFGNSNDITSNPIFISLDSGITLANNHNIRGQDCMLLGAAKGELGDERGTIILNKISCVLTDQRTNQTYKVEDRIEGWVFGEDGVVGLKGRLVTKEGKIIATALPLTLLETLLSYIKDKAKTSATIVDGSGLTGGIAGYVAKGSGSSGDTVLKKLSDIYIKYLDELNPIVSILPGRKVTIAFRGTTKPLELKKFRGLDVAFFEKENVNSSDYYDYSTLEEKDYE